MVSRAQADEAGNAVTDDSRAQRSGESRRSGTRRRSHPSRAPGPTSSAPGSFWSPSPCAWVRPGSCSRLKRPGAGLLARRSLQRHAAFLPSIHPDNIAAAMAARDCTMDGALTFGICNLQGAGIGPSRSISAPAGDVAIPRPRDSLRSRSQGAQAGDGLSSARPASRRDRKRRDSLADRRLPASRHGGARRVTRPARLRSGKHNWRGQSD